MTAYASTKRRSTPSAGLSTIYPTVTATSCRLHFRRTIDSSRAPGTGRLRGEVDWRSSHGEMIGKSEAMEALREHIRKIAATEATVLITGESGTGKELVARSLHRCSRRRAQPFVPVDCAALPESLLESELFGHEKGAFTGASLSRPGLFELAHKGTLFLDEVAELPPPLQAKLLRVLEARQLRRLGGRQLISIDVRLIAATNRDLTKAMEIGAFARILLSPHVSPSRPPPAGARGDVPCGPRISWGPNAGEWRPREFAPKPGCLNHTAGRKCSRVEKRCGACRAWRIGGDPARRLRGGPPLGGEAADRHTDAFVKR